MAGGCAGGVHVRGRCVAWAGAARSGCVFRVPCSQKGNRTNACMGLPLSAAGSNIVINNWEVEVEEAMGADKFE